MIKLKVLAVEKDGRATEYRLSPSPVMLGGKDSYGVETLHLTVPEDWAGATVFATFTPELCEGKAWAMTAPIQDENGNWICQLEITDKAVTAVPKGKVTISAVFAEDEAIAAQIHTHSVPYIAYDHEDLGEEITEEPEPGAWEQYIASVQKAVTQAFGYSERAAAAATAAQTAEANAKQSEDWAQQDMAEAEQSAESAAQSAADAAKRASAAASSAAAAQYYAEGTGVEGMYGGAKGYAAAAEKAAAEAAQKAASVAPFYATFGETPFDEIEAAYLTGRAVKVIQGTQIGDLSLFKNDLEDHNYDYAHFVTTDYAGTDRQIRVTRNGTWSIVQSPYAKTTAVNDAIAGAKTFYATYDETTFEEIETAYLAGRDVKVIYNVSCIGCLTLISLKEEEYNYNSAEFEITDSNGVNRLVKCSRTDGWNVYASPYVKKTDIATAGGDAGLVKIAALNYGIETHGSNGYLALQQPNDYLLNTVDERKNTRIAVTLAWLDKALKASITTNTETLTDEEKAAALAWLGAVQKDTTVQSWLAGQSTVYATKYDTYGNPSQGTEYISSSPTSGRIPRWTDKGTLKTNTPQADNDAANKAYVDGLAAFYTTLQRTKQQLDVVCHGLVAGETYTVQLFAATRRRGNARAEWRHPSNESVGTGFTGKGYARLTTQKYAGEKATAETDAPFYPSVPAWMPRDGILQTEWTFTASAATHVLTIDLAEWILPMLKPDKDAFTDFTSGTKCQLIGVANGVVAPLLMQFRVARNSTGTIGESKNTLRIGVGVDENGAAGTITVATDKESGAYRANGLYISIA